MTTTPEPGAPIVFERDGLKWTLLSATGEPGDLLPTQLDATPADLLAAGFVARAELDAAEGRVLDVAAELDAARSGIRGRDNELHIWHRRLRDVTAAAEGLLAWSRKHYPLNRGKPHEMTRLEELLTVSAMKWPEPEAAKAAEGKVERTVREFTEERLEQLSRAYDSPLTQAALGYTTEPQPPAGSKDSSTSDIAYRDGCGPAESGGTGLQSGVAPSRGDSGHLPAGGGEERVTAVSIRSIVNGHIESSEARAKVHRYISQQEQSEREAAALRAEVAELKAERDGLRAELASIGAGLDAIDAAADAHQRELDARDAQQSPASAEPSLWSSERYAAVSPGRDRPVMVGEFIKLLRDTEPDAYGHRIREAFLRLAERLAALK